MISMYFVFGKNKESETLFNCLLEIFAFFFQLRKAESTLANGRQNNNHDDDKL